MGREESLRQAIVAFRAGRKDEARRLLSRILETDPRDEDAWLWMSAAVDTDEQRIDCHRQVLAINPNNAAARDGLAQLTLGSLASETTSVLEHGRDAPGVETLSSPQGIEPERRLSLAIVALSGIGVLIGCALLLGICLVPRVLVGPATGQDSFASLAELRFPVLDAEYSLALDRIVMVSDHPPRLHIFDPATHTDVTVDLAWSPTSISVGPDGRFAAVGHDGRISYVDLEAGRVTKTLDVLTDVYDLVLAGNGWIYASPGRGQWVKLHAVHVETNREVENSGYNISAGSVYKLHPDGQSLYGADSGLYPSDIEKLDISDGVPAYAHDSPHHGDYPMGGDLWLSEDGQRIFTAGGSVFRASSNLEQDMTYAGSLTGLHRIQHLVHSSSAGLALAIRARGWQDEDWGTVENQLFIYEYENLNLEGIVTLPDFVGWGLRRPANGRFVFVNAAGTRYYVIAQTKSALGLGGSFGLVSGDLSPEALASLSPALIPSDQASGAPIQASDGQFAPFGFRVVDAEYSLSLDRIVIVSDEPAQLHVYDPANQTDTAVDLSRPPTCVSVGPDGRFAAVGHDALLSYVDLESAQVVKTVGLTTDVADVVLAGNGWMYASPLRGQWGVLHAIQVDADHEVPSMASIYEGSVYRLHPDGRSLYGADRLGPSDIEKIDISGDTPSNAYESPSQYRGDYPICSDLWLSEDGQRIFTACGNVFRASSDRERDMIYDGSLSGLRLIEHLVHSSAAKVILAARARHWDEEDPDPVENQLLVFEYEDLTLQRVVTLPDLVVNGQTWTAHGRFVFANSAGTQYYVIVQVDPNSGLPDQFGLVLGDVSPEPTDVVSAEPSPSPEGPITPLDFRVIDAEYSLSLDRAVLVSDNPAQLHVYDPTTSTDIAVDLPLAPSSVSVGPEGRFAAVGHNSRISYVDIERAEVLKTLDVTTDVFDVVLAGNGWIYASGARGQRDETLRGVHIETNTEALHVGGHYGTVIKLDAGGETLYGIRPGQQFADFYKTDISEGAPVAGGQDSYDDPCVSCYYHCDAWDFWPSQDGQRILTSCGAVFRASSDVEQHMTYEGALVNVLGIAHLVDSASAGVIVVVPGMPSYYIDPGIAENEILIFARDNLKIERTVTLPDFAGSGLPCAANGRFVFVNAAGTEYYVIVQAEEGSGVLHDFGVVSGEL